MAIGLCPANEIRVRPTLPGLQAHQQIGGAPPAAFQTLGTLCLRLQQCSQHFQLAKHAAQAIGETGARFELLQRVARWLDWQGQPQVASGFFEQRTALRQIQAVARRGQTFELRIAGQFEELRGRDAVAKEQAGNFRQLVCFVKDHRVAGGKQFGSSFVAEHHVGEEQVMVDHHQVGGQRFAACSEDEALLVLRAVLTEAVVASGSDHRPHRRILGNPGTLGFVTAAGLPGKARDTLRIGGVVTRKETAIGKRKFKVVMTQVVGSPLEQCHLDR